MAIVTKEELAGRLDGREYRDEVTKQDCIDARESGLLIVFGASDDLMEVRGVVDDEYGAYNGGTHLVAGAMITAEWSPDDDLTFRMTADQPYAAFTIGEDGAPYCRGAVVDVSVSNRPEHRILAELQQSLDIGHRQRNEPCVTAELLESAVNLPRAQAQKIKALEAEEGQ
jgi:hypothetical protein